MAALGAGLGFLTISAVAFAPTNLAGVCGAAVSTSLALLSPAWAMAAAIALKNPPPRTDKVRDPPLKNHLTLKSSSSPPPPLATATHPTLPRLESDQRYFKIFGGKNSSQ